MTLSVYWGILTCALLVPVVLGVPLCPKKGRLPAALVVVILALCPFFPEGFSLAQHIFSFTDTLSVLLVVGLVGKLFGSGREFVSWNLPEIGFLLLFGLVLYASSLGLLPDVIYGAGFRPVPALGAAFLCMGIASDWKKRLCIAGAFGSFLVGLYANFFDALFDPILWVIAFFGALTKLASRSKIKTNKE